MKARPANDGSGEISQLPGLSPRGRAVLAGLESTRLLPGQVQEALWYWRVYLRDPRARRWDRPDCCGEWHCCPDIGEVCMVLRVVVHHLPRRDARRFRSALGALGGDPL